jgi:DNA helicase HerA-like ATPase
VESRARVHQSLLRNARAVAESSRFEMDPKSLIRQTLLLGATGSGKTTQSFGIIADSVLGEKVPSCVVIDVKREYRHLPIDGGRLAVNSLGVENGFRFNPLFPPAGDRRHWERAFVDVFTRSYGLAEPSRRIMLDSLLELGQGSKDSPTLRELEFQVARFRSGSPREENSRRSLESRLHIINSGPMGDALNSEASLDFGKLDGGITVFEIGEVDSMKDHRFLAELLLASLWFHDKFEAGEPTEAVRRLIVVEEAHRYLSEERPPDQRGERTLLELPIAEGRRYGWAFLILDQMHVLLSRYVWDNAGTVFFHRLTNRDSLEMAWKVLVEDPLARGPVQGPDALSALLLSLPEDLAVYRRYKDAGGTVAGVAVIPRTPVSP